MNNNTCNEYTVVIIGAGMAGLGAALTLSPIFHSQKAGNFKIFEAQSFPGGRIKTLHVDNSTIDLGAQWLHGFDNDLYKILRENELIHEETSDEALGVYVRDDGLIIDDFLVKRVDFEFGRILEQCEQFTNVDLVLESAQNNQNQNVVIPKSVGHFVEEKFRDFLLESDFTDEQKLIMRDLYDWHVRFQLIDNSCGDLQELSAKDWGRYSCLGKDGQKHVNLKGGYAALVDILVAKLPENSIEFNKVVKNIETLDNSLEITCFDGSVTRAEHVFLTCSLGVLKSTNSPLKTMEMPQETRSVIENMGFGGMGKVFLHFHTPWWKPNGFQLVWRQNSDMPPSCPPWLRHLSGFDRVLDQPNILVGWVSHLGVEEMENSPENVIGVQCVHLLRHFLQDDTVPFPKKVYKSTWYTNPYFKGGYSHTTPACDSGTIPARVLAAPLPAGPAGHNLETPRLFFAGEAAHESHFSTTHGAFESGQLQAHKLLDFLNLTEQKVTSKFLK